jgi:hypothetical protein
MKRLSHLGCRAYLSRLSPLASTLQITHVASGSKGFATTHRFCKDDRVTIRHFEEEGGRFKLMSGPKDEEKDLKVELEKIEEEISAIETSPGLDLDKVSRDAEEVLEKYFKKELKDANEAEEEDVDLEEEAEADIPEDIDELSVQFPEHQRIHLKSFNHLLRSVASQDKDFRNTALLWTKYIQCKRSVPGFLPQISPAAWKVLWYSQYYGNPVIESRTRHVWILVDDMVQSGQRLNTTQTLVRIESMASRGNKKNAMKLWISEWGKLARDDPAREEFRDLGIRLNAEMGQLQEAHQLAFGAIQSHGKLRTEDIATLIAAWCQKGDEDSLKIAWSLYLDLRTRQGSQMSMEDYDQIIMTFISVQRPNLALAVFKDLVLSVRTTTKSTDAQKKSLQLFEELQKSTSNVADLNRVSLATLASIPKALENKYFYASWIKRLIGLDEVDSTIPVLDLMLQRRIRPDARHMNGILGAWLRGKDKNKHQLAMQIAWNMVKERLKFVARRRSLNNGQFETMETPDLGVLIPPFISRNLPPANIETFSLLLLYYERRGMQGSVKTIQEFLREAEIKPNSYFMNHLIFAELRKGKVGEAWKIFNSMGTIVKPDLETFAALWECEKVHTSGRSMESSETFPSSRKLFSMMSEWLSTVSGRALKTSREEFSKDMYNEIIRCFCFQRDPSGTVVALYGLRELFGAYPDPDTVRLVTLQLARMGEEPILRRKRSRARARLSANQDSVRNIQRFEEITKLVSDGRSEALQAFGVDEGTLDEKQRGEELLYIIAEVLRFSLRHASGTGVEVISPQEETLDQLAFDMGVGGIDMEPPKYEVGDGNKSTS